MWWLTQGLSRSVPNPLVSHGTYMYNDNIGRSQELRYMTKELNFSTFPVIVEHPTREERFRATFCVSHRIHRVLTVSCMHIFQKYLGCTCLIASHVHDAILRQFLQNINSKPITMACVNDLTLYLNTQKMHTKKSFHKILLAKIKPVSLCWWLITHKHIINILVGNINKT